MIDSSKDNSSLPLVLVDQIFEKRLTKLLQEAEYNNLPDRVQAAKHLELHQGFFDEQTKLLLMKLRIVERGVDGWEKMVKTIRDLPVERMPKSPVAPAVPVMSKESAPGNGAPKVEAPETNAATKAAPEAVGHGEIKKSERIVEREKYIAEGKKLALELGLISNGEHEAAPGEKRKRVFRKHPKMLGLFVDYLKAAPRPQLREREVVRNVFGVKYGPMHVFLKKVYAEYNIGATNGAAYEQAVAKVLTGEIQKPVVAEKPAVVVKPKKMGRPSVNSARPLGILSGRPGAAREFVEENVPVSSSENPQVPVSIPGSLEVENESAARRSLLSKRLPQVNEVDMELDGKTFLAAAEGRALLRLLTPSTQLKEPSEIHIRAVSQRLGMNREQTREYMMVLCDLMKIKSNQNGWYLELAKRVTGFMTPPVDPRVLDNNSTAFHLSELSFEL